VPSLTRQVGARSNETLTRGHDGFEDHTAVPRDAEV